MNLSSSHCRQLLVKQWAKEVYLLSGKMPAFFAEGNTNEMLNWSIKIYLTFRSSSGKTFILLRRACSLSVVLLNHWRNKITDFPCSIHVSASRLTESLDESVDPCDNFYDFSCGSWRKKTIITEDRSSINMFGVVRDDVEVTLKCLYKISISNYSWFLVWDICRLHSFDCR